MNTMLAERAIEWTKEWKKEGLVEGLQEGLQQGEATILTRLLTRRFGPLPESVQVRLKQAPTDQLERWAERVLDASRLEDVFEQLEGLRNRPEITSRKETGFPGSQETTDRFLRSANHRLIFVERRIKDHGDIRQIPKTLD